MGWVKLKLRDRDSKKNRARHTEVASKRLSQVFSSNNGAPVGAPLPLSRRSRPRHRTRSAPRQLTHIGTYALPGSADKPRILPVVSGDERNTCR